MACDDAGTGEEEREDHGRQERAGREGWWSTEGCLGGAGGKEEQP